MEPIAKILNRALTETVEHTTKERRSFTEMLPLAQKAYPDFQTFNDPELQKLLVEGLAFSLEMLESKPRWLSMVGKSGTGKTFLAEKLYREARNNPYFISHRTLLNGVTKTFWPTLLSDLRDGRYHRIRDLAEANFVFIDEIAVEHDPSGFGKDKLCELLSLRVEKWTLLTSNLTLEKLAEIDTRISARMIRGGSIVVEVNALDYFLR